MTDKEKIRAEIERRMKCFKNERNTITKASDNNLSLGARIAMCEEILSFINSMKEEPVSGCKIVPKPIECYSSCKDCPFSTKPVSKVWHDSNEEQPNFESTVAILNPKYKNGEIISRCIEVYPDRIWAYIDDLLKM